MALIRLQRKIELILSRDFHPNQLLNRLIQKAEIDKAVADYGRKEAVFNSDLPQS